MSSLEGIFRQAHFTYSAPAGAKLPADEGAEVAFAGRSNAGKSSAINAIAGQSGLARTSKTPGRTQAINFFDLDDGHALVDLPGYGFAKAPKAMQQRWGRAIESYLERRQSLNGLVLMMDIRHPFKSFDSQMLDWCIAARLPAHVLLTKSDKLSRGKASAVLLQVRGQLAGMGGELSVQLFSATKGSGVDQARTLIAVWLGVEPVDKSRAKKTPA